MKPEFSCPELICTASPFPVNDKIPEKIISKAFNLNFIFSFICHHIMEGTCGARRYLFIQKIKRPASVQSSVMANRNCPAPEWMSILPSFLSLITISLKVSFFFLFSEYATNCCTFFFETEGHAVPKLHPGGSGRGRGVFSSSSVFFYLSKMMRFTDRQRRFAGRCNYFFLKLTFLSMIYKGKRPDLNFRLFIFV